MFAAVEFPEASLFLSGALIPETGYFPTCKATRPEQCVAAALRLGPITRTQSAVTNK